MTDQIHVLFSEEGEACAIRKWSKEPFDDAQTYVQKALLDTLAARVLELEAENKRLREGLEAVMTHEPDYSDTAWETARAALKGGEI